MNTNVACTIFLAFIGIVCIQGCPTGWEEYGGICYLFVKTAKNYGDAEKYCHSVNGYLAEPRTAGENNFIASKVHGKAYIGYSDRKYEGKFVGVRTHTPLTYSNWWKHEPNNAGNEDCTEIGFGHSVTWNDIPCHLARQSVCQLNRCPPGWQSFKDKCYLSVKEGKKYQDAENHCRSVGGFLAEPTSREENQFIAKIRKGKAYIGYNDRKHEGHFVGVRNQTPLTYSNWWKHEPNNAGNEDCTEIGFGHSDTWNDIPCHLARQSVCELNSCPDGWQSFKGKCYLVVTKSRNYQAAENHCRSLGGFLTEPRSQEENTFINKIRTGKAYIGYNDRQKEGRFVGVHTKSPLTYTNWWTHEPNNAGNEDCTEIGFPHGSTWNDIPCHLARQSICELKAPLPKLCPPHWKGYGDSCYLLSKGKASWCEARMVCQRMGGKLAEPRDEGQNNFLTHLSKNRLWIGLNDVIKEKTFEWDSDLSHLGKFQPWDKNQPDNHQNREDCVETNHGGPGKWNDSPCEYHFQYVCQKQSQ